MSNVDIAFFILSLVIGVLIHRDFAKSKAIRELEKRILKAEMRQFMKER